MVLAVWNVLNPKRGCPGQGGLGMARSEAPRCHRGLSEVSFLVASPCFAYTVLRQVAQMGPQPYSNGFLAPRPSRPIIHRDPLRILNGHMSALPQGSPSDWLAWVVSAAQQRGRQWGRSSAQRPGEEVLSGELMAGGSHTLKPHHHSPVPERRQQVMGAHSHKFKS